MGAALRYLLGRPVPVGSGGPWSPLAFPLVGVLVGIAWVLASRMLLVLPRTTAVAAAGILLVDAVLTRAVHMRAFSQAVDESAAGPASAGRAGEELRQLRPVAGAGSALLLLVVLVRFGVLFFAAEFDQRLVTVPLSGRAAMLWLLWRSTADDPRRAPLAAALGGPAPVALAAAAALSVAVSAVAGTRGLVALGLALAVGLAWDLAAQRFQRPRTGVEVAAAGFVAETVALLALGAV